MRSKLFRSLLGMVLLLTGAGIAVAQSATNGAIGGTIYDNTGAVIPDAQIEATNADTGQVVKAKATEAGTYRILEVAPGRYTVQVKAEGYNLYKASDVRVTVGSLTDISPKMVVGAVTSVVEVTDSTPEIQTQSPEISSTIDQDQIDNLPINGRRWSSFALLTPGVVSNSDGFGLLSFRGVSFLLNNSTVDGADNNQAYFSEERGRTRASYTISQAAVQEFQVNTSNYSAEYGRAAGGVVNTVTKSGSNAVHGELFFYDRDNQWGATNPYTQLVTLNPSTNQFVATAYKPKDWRKQWGFGVGGPILKDKLFWFYSYDQSRRNFPGTARASDPSDTFAPADSVLPAGATCKTNPSTAGTSLTSGPGVYAGSGLNGNQYACALAGALGFVSSGNGAAAYQSGAAYYTQGLQVLSTFLGTVPRNSDQVLNFPRIDWQINDRNRLTVQYNRLRNTAPAGVQTQATNFYGRSSFGNDFVKDDWGLVRFTTTLSNSMVNEFRAQYGRDFEYQLAQAPLPNEVPLANNQFGTMPDASLGYYFDLAGFDVGRTYLLNRNSYPDERRIQGFDGVTWSHGKHTTKFGVDINRVYDGTNNLYEEGGSYSYDWQWDFIADYLHATTGIGGSAYKQRYYSFTQGLGNGQISISTTDWNAYVSDDWRITPRLTLTAGLRYEYEYIPGNPYVNAALPVTASRPDDRNNFGPRFGFAYDVFGTGNTFLRGGYGMYYGRVINANISLAYSNSGSPKGQLAQTFTNSSGCNFSFPQILTTTTAPAGCSFQTPTVAYLDPRMQNPQVHEADLALEQKLGWGTVMSVMYMSSFGREMPSVFDTNAPFPGVAGNAATPGTVKLTVCNSGCSVNQGGGVGLNPYPRGGHDAPLINGTVHTYKLYTGNRPNSDYYAIYKVTSNSNSAYNALAVQLNKRFSNGLSFLSSYTWAHALDYNPYLGTSFGSSAYLPLDFLDHSQDYGNSNMDVRNRFVFSAHWSPRVNVRGWLKPIADGWNISPIFQAQTGLPYTAGTSGQRAGSGAALSGPLGAGGAPRLPKFDYFGNLEVARNSFQTPNKQLFDLRLSKNFFKDAFNEHFRLEVFAELFNVFNHQNITSVSTGAYTICTGAQDQTQAGSCPNITYPTGSGLLIFNNNFGTNKASNGNTLYTPRQLQLAARLHF